MSNSYTLTQHLTPRATQGARGGHATSMGNSAGQTDGSGTPLEWHKHNNLSLLQRFSTDNDGYLYLAAAPTSDKPNEGAEGQGSNSSSQPHKIRAGWADVAGNVDKSSPIWSKFDNYLSKIQDDTAKGHITYDKGLTAKGKAHLQEGAVFGALPTYYVDAEGRAHLRDLAIDEHLDVPELRYNRTNVHIGYELQSPAAGIIERVERLTDEVGKVYLKLQEGELATVEVGDLLTGIYHATTAQGGATKDSDDGRLNLTFAGFATTYFKVETVDSERKWFTYSLRPNTTFHPQPHMTFASRGSTSRVERQHFAVHTRTYTRYLRGVNQWDILASHVAMQQGELDNLHELGYPNEISGVGLFADNVYLTGKVVIDGKLRDFADIVQDLDGKIADNRLYLEYSKDGKTDWHAPAQDGDQYLRQRKGEHGAWSDAVRFAGKPVQRFFIDCVRGSQFYRAGQGYVGTFRAVLEEDNVDITDTVHPSRIKWTRESEGDDNYWALQHAHLAREIEITTNDLAGQTTLICTLYTPNGETESTHKQSL